MEDYESWLVLHIACQSTIRSGRREVPELMKLGKPGGARLPRSSRINRTRSFPRLFDLDGHQQQTLRDRKSTANGNLSESATESRAPDTDASDRDWHWPAVTVSRLAPAGEAEEDLADFNFGDSANNAASVRMPASD